MITALLIVHIITNPQCKILCSQVLLCRGKYYKMHSHEDLQLFLSDPDNFLYPKAPYKLPPSNNLPRKKSHIDIKTLFPKQFEVNGFCSVCYVDGNKR